MVLSKREKYIGIGAIVAVALLAINSLILGPYYDRVAELKGDLSTARHTMDENQHLLIKQKTIQSEWNAMLASGLEADDSTARLRTQQMIQTWARVADVNLNALSSDRTSSSQKGPFQAINFSLDFNESGNDGMRQIARFLWAIETAHIPIRLNNIHIQSTREGTDQLNIKMVVSALYMPPTGQSGAQSMEDFYDMEGSQ